MTSAASTREKFMPFPLPSAGGERKKKARANCWKTLITTIGVVSEETIPDVEAAEQEDPTLSKVELLCLGKLRGTKFTHESDSFRGPWKSVRYLLATPEGHVFISM